jgi:malic enzyme
MVNLERLPRDIDRYMVLSACRSLGAVACRATSLPDEVFLAAARTLAQRVQQTDLDHGSLYHRCKRSERSRLPSRLALPRRRTPWVWRARRPKHLRQAIAGVMYQP